MQNVNGLKVYVINLDRSPERLKAMDERLNKIGLSYERVSAVDGKITEFSKKQVNAKKYSLLHGKYITPTEVACFVSHIKAWEKFKKDVDVKFALILEDDMVFSDDFVDVLKSLIENHSCWDMVKLNGNHKGGAIKVKDLTDKSILVLNAFHQSKAGAYIMNRKAVNSYMKKIYPMFVPIDHEFVKFWKYKIKIFSVNPFPSWEEGGPSTIDYKMVKKNRKPIYKKFPVMIYKSYIALIRLLFVGIFLLKNKFTFKKK